MNALIFAAATNYPVASDVSRFGYSREWESDYPALLTPDEQAEVEEALALSYLGVTCFNCCFGASFDRSGQFWCSIDCWIDVMNGGRDYWYEAGDEISADGQVGVV